MDAYEEVSDPTAEVKPGDLFLCFNCCAVYTRAAESWRLCTDRELQRLKPEMQVQIDRVKLARQAIYSGDLSFEQQHDEGPTQ